MLKIVRCGFSSAARDNFAEEILRLTEAGKRSLLIVPEQQTVMAEGLMSTVLPSDATLLFEVTNFTRLANTTFRALGGLSGEYCNSTKKALIMWRVLTELSPALKMTEGRREITSGLVDTALGAVAQMQSLAISPLEIAKAAEDGSVKQDRRLSDKLTDLAAIYSLYKEILGQRYADTGDDADAMVKLLRQNPEFLSDTRIFIEGFSSFTEPQYELISLLCARCDVSVALTLPKGREEAFEFSEIADCQSRLVSSARKEGADIKLARVESANKSKDSGLDEICSLLWSTIKPNENISLQNKENLRIFEAKTPYDECAFVCEDIKRRVMLGASYSDFAIVVRSAEGYAGILDRALESSGIPAFSSYKRDLQELEAIKLIYTAYSALQGFSREDVLSYSKCVLSGVSREECDELEMYVNKWQISGKGFTDAEAWNMNPLGYTTRRSADMDEKLLRIDLIRHKLIDPLLSFSRKSDGATSVREHAVALMEFLLQVDMPSGLEKRAESLRSIGENALAEDNRVLWRIICDSLDTLVEVLGDSPADRNVFLSQLKVIFSSVGVGRIPAFVDNVTVGSADMLRLYEKKHIYLLGVNAGKFPSTVSDSSYFSDRDKRVLGGCGLAISPEMEIKGARELYIFSRAFSYARDSVTISYSSCDARFKSVEPADVIGRIKELTGGEVAAVKISSIPLGEKIYSAGFALSNVGMLEEDYSVVREALVESGYDRDVSVLEGSISCGSSRLGESIIKDNSRPLSLTQTKIDSYVSCPFGYFCRYSIGLGEDERAEFDARSIGSFIHAILENFFGDLSREGRRSADLTAKDREELTLKAAQKYIEALGEDLINSSPRTKIKINRLCRAARPIVDGLCEEFSQSAFEPRFFELSIGRGGEELPDAARIDTDGGRVNIYGVIDRVDAYKKGDDVYIRVVDYKTGQKEFSPLDIDEGRNLQMFLYLKALVESDKAEFRKALDVGEGGRLVPAGVIYVKTSVSDVRIDLPDDEIAEQAVKNTQHREGMILDDPDVISAMSLRYTPVYSGRTPDRIPEGKKKLLYSEDGWQDIMNRVEKAVSEVADGIRGGNISAEPKEDGGRSPCEYCPYKPVCRK